MRVQFQKEKALSLLAEYEENEEANLHAENCLLLAEAFEDDIAIAAAERTLSFQRVEREVPKEFSALSHELTRDYYYYLKVDAEQLGEKEAEEIILFLKQ